MAQMSDEIYLEGSMGEVGSVCVFVRGKELVQQLQPRAAGKLQGPLAVIGEVEQAHAAGANKSAGSSSRILSRSAHTAARQTRAALVVSSPWDRMWHELPLQQHRWVDQDTGHKQLYTRQAASHL